MPGFNPYGRARRPRFPYATVALCGLITALLAISVLYDWRQWTTSLMVGAVAAGLLAAAGIASYWKS